MRKQQDTAGIAPPEPPKKPQDPGEIAPPKKPREYTVYPALIERCTELEPVTTAVAHPCDEASLTAAVEAGDLSEQRLAGWRSLEAEAAAAELRANPHLLRDRNRRFGRAVRDAQRRKRGER